MNHVSDITTECWLYQYNRSFIRVDKNISVRENASHTTVSEQIIDQLDIVFNCFFLHFLCLLGVLTNTLNILVLWKHSFKETTTIWLFSMSISDLIASLLQPLRRLNCIISQFDQVAGLTFRSISVVYLLNIPDIFTSVSVFHTTFIALERLVAVWFTLKVSSIFTTYRVKLTIGLMYSYTVVMLSPTWFFLDFAYVYDTKYNATRGAYFLSRFYASDYDNLYKYSSLSLPHVFVTPTFLAIVTCSVIISIKLTFSRRKELSRLSSTNSTTKLIKDLKTVKMVLAVCVANSGLSLPTVAIHLYIFANSLSIQTAGKLHYMLRSIIHVLYQINADVNFIIYVKMSSKFARALSELFKIFKRQRSFPVVKSNSF